MGYERFFTEMSFVLFLVTVVFYSYWARRLPLGTLSLPCITLLTSLVYFQILPAVTLADGDPGFVGVYMSDMSWAHLAALLYIGGAILAFATNWKAVYAKPVSPQTKHGINKRAFRLLSGIAIVALITRVSLGKLNLLYSDEYAFDAENMGQFAFLVLSDHLVVALTLVFLAFERFSVRSVAALAVVIAILLQAGFRTPIVYILVSATSIWFAQRGWKPGLAVGVIGCIALVALSIALGAIRQYGRGIDLSGLTNENISGQVSRGGGELGVAYVLDDVASHSLPEPNWYEPWTVGFLGLVPSFIWPDKPKPQYFKHMYARMTPDAERGGIAGPQHVEFMYQFGWFGILPLAFLYFSVACWSIRKLNTRGGEAPLVWATLAPIFFGLTMQTRCYFFATFCNTLVLWGTLYLVSVDRKLLSAIPPRPVLFWKRRKPGVKARGQDQAR